MEASCWIQVLTPKGKVPTRKGKRLVGVSNHDRYDDHQDDLLAAMSARCHLVWCQDLARLPEAIAQARTASCTPYHEEQGQLVEIIMDFILHGRRPARG